MQYARLTPDVCHSANLFVVLCRVRDARQPEEKTHAADGVAHWRWVLVSTTCVAASLWHAGYPGRRLCR